MTCDGSAPGRPDPLRRLRRVMSVGTGRWLPLKNIVRLDQHEPSGVNPLVLRFCLG